MSKRQGGHNIIDQQSKCEITCIGKHRKPETGGGKSVSAAAKICRNMCNTQSKKREQIKKGLKGKKTAKRSFLNLREEDDDDVESDDQSDSNEDQQRREFLETLQEQLENNDDE